MADITGIIDLEISRTAHATNPVVTVARKISDSDTTLITSSTLLNKDGTVITKAVILGIRKANGYVENVYVAAAGISGTTVTITTRGLKLGGIDFTATLAGNAVSHEQGEEVLVNVSPFLLQEFQDALQGDIGSTYKLNARPSYLGVGVHSDRVFADATARDAAITSPTNGDRCYNTALGVFQKYQAGAWADDATGTTANASATVAGKVEIATSAESIAGTDTGATGALLSVLPSDLAINIQNQKHVYAADSVGTDAYAITIAPATAAYAAGQRFTFKAGTANTGGATLAVSGLAAKTILKFNDQALETGDIESGQIVEVVYDGTNFQMQTPVASQMSTANSATLTAGTTSYADSLHTHAIVPYFEFPDEYGFTVNSTDYSVNSPVKLNKVAISADGNYMYTLRFATGGANMYIARYVKNSVGTFSHDNVAVTVSDSGSYGSNTYSTFSPGIAVGTNYVWVSVMKTDNSVSKILRFNLDLTGETLMTGDGTAASGSLCGGDSTLYIFPYGQLTVYPITISGTTITTGSSATTPLSSSYAVYFDGTYLHQWDGTTYHKINTSGTSQASITMKRNEGVSFGKTGNSFYIFGSTLRNQTYSNDASNNVYKYWNATVITQL